MRPPMRPSMRRMRDDEGIMEHEVKRYWRYKTNIKLMLVGSGLWPDYRPHPKAFRTFLTVCFAFTNTAITLGNIAFVCKNVTNINLLTKGLGLMIAFLSVFLKVLALSIHEKDLKILNEGVSVNFENDIATPASQAHLLAHFPTFSRFFYTFNYSTAINISMMIITPLLMVKHGKYLRVYPQIIPFSYEPGGIVHWLMYAFEILAGFYLWTISCGVDSVFGLYTLHVIGELRLLSSRFENLKSSENYKKDLKDCVDRHVLLMETRPVLERVFGFLSIWLAVTCAIAMCTIIFQVSQTTSTTVFRVCYLLCYCFVKLVQAYSYAWFGNIITVESEMCLNSIYNAFWPDSGDTNFMRDVLIILSQKPFIFKAKGCVLVRLDMFSTIVKTSVSYFFLLRTLEESLVDS